MRVSGYLWFSDDLQLTRSVRYTFTVGIASAAIYSVLEPIEKATGLTLDDLNAGTGYMVEYITIPAYVY